jgi:hypothetical protein
MWDTKAFYSVDAYPMVNPASVRPRTTEYHVFDVQQPGGRRAGALIVAQVMNYAETSPFEEDTVCHDPDAHAEHLPELQSTVAIRIEPWPQP